MNTPDAASRLQSAAARAWIARLSALLPAAEAERVRTDVKAGARTRPMVTLKWPSDSDEGGVDI